MNQLRRDLDVVNSDVLLKNQIIEQNQINSLQEIQNLEQEMDRESEVARQLLSKCMAGQGSEMQLAAGGLSGCSCT